MQLCGKNNKNRRGVKKGNEEGGKETERGGRRGKNGRTKTDALLFCFFSKWPNEDKGREGDKERGGGGSIPPCMHEN